MWEKLNTEVKRHRFLSQEDAKGHTHTQPAGPVTSSSQNVTAACFSEKSNRSVSVCYVNGAECLYFRTNAGFIIHDLSCFAQIKIKLRLPRYRCAGLKLKTVIIVWIVICWLETKVLHFCWKKLQVVAANRFSIVRDGCKQIILGLSF